MKSLRTKQLLFVKEQEQEQEGGSHCWYRTCSRVWCYRTWAGQAEQGADNRCHQQSQTWHCDDSGPGSVQRVQFSATGNGHRQGLETQLQHRSRSKLKLKIGLKVDRLQCTLKKKWVSRPDLK